MKEIASGLIAVFFVGLFAGHFIWGASRVQLVRTEYDAIANTKECAKLGGQIESKTSFYDNESGYYGVTFHCIVPRKEISL